MYHAIAGVLPTADQQPALSRSIVQRTDNFRARSRGKHDFGGLGYAESCSKCVVAKVFLMM